jgi:hypothetical protein
MIGNAIGTFFQRKKGKGVGPLPPIPDLEGVIGLYIAKGLTNDSMKENPVWKDKSGLGNDFQMKNFSWSVESGCGLYPINMPADLSVDQPFGTLHFTTSTAYSYTVRARSTDPITIRFKVRGLTNDIYKHFVIRSVSTSDGTTIDLKRYYEDGIYEYHYEGTGGLFSVVFYNGIGTPANFSDFYVEIIPDYQGAIVFDGVDDYGFCDTFPILTKEKGYTVMALRKWLTPEAKTSNEVIVSNLYNTDWSSINLGAFNCEVKYNNLNPKIINAISYSSSSRINIDENDLLFYQTSNNYNGNIIEVGNKNQGGSGSRNNLYANSAIYALCIIDHDTSDAERQLVIDYWKQEYPELFFDQAWTVTGKTNDDEDRATVKNLTGNGNDLRLSNFAFAGDSGYGLYAQNYNSYNITNRAIFTTTSSAIHITESKIAGANFLETGRGVEINSYKVRVTGIQPGQDMKYRGSSNSYVVQIPSDGIYTLPNVSNGANLGFQFETYVGLCNVIIEQIPDYEGYLVTDGVDDSVRALNINLGENFTLIGEWRLFSDTPIVNAGMSLLPQLHIFNRPSDGININFRSVSTTLYVKTLKAICSDGRCYDDDWNDLNINVGDTISSNINTLFLGYNGTNFTKIAFKNLAIYNGKVLTKDQCIAGYNLLQTFKNS